MADQVYIDDIPSKSQSDGIVVATVAVRADDSATESNLKKLDEAMRQVFGDEVKFRIKKLPQSSKFTVTKVEQYQGDVIVYHTFDQKPSD